MRKVIALAVLGLFALVAAGCGGVKEAHSELKGAEASIVSDRDEKRPSEQSITITAKGPAPRPIYDITITMPKEEAKGTPK